jgi:3,4-dihydroxy 2-butanone 4-phosphate synthase/GTP cyclohydrolase II
MNTNTEPQFSDVEDAIADFRIGKFVIVTDDESRENEGDFIIAAPFCDARAVNFMAREGRGLICVPMESARLEELGSARWRHKTPTATRPRSP